MCPPCSSLVLGDATTRGHLGLRPFGEPVRHTAPARLTVWIINYQCDDCHAEWHFRFHPTDRTGGFQMGKYEA